MPSKITPDHVALAEAYVRNTASTRPSHDLSHALRVHNLALRLAFNLPSNAPVPDIPLVRLAALLHDLFDHKLVSSEDDPSALLRHLLDDLGLNPADAQRVSFICENLSYSKQSNNPLAVSKRTIELDIVQDADRLDAIGAIGVARCLAYTGEVGNSLAAARCHFDVKLVMLRDLMRTLPAKNIAERRHQLLLEFMAAWDHESSFAGQKPQSNVVDVVQPVRR